MRYAGLLVGRASDTGGRGRPQGGGERPERVDRMSARFVRLPGQGWGWLALLGAATLLAGPEARAMQPPAAQTQPAADPDLVQLNEGITLYLAGDLARAREVLTALVARSPQNAAALYYLGLTELRLGLQAATAPDRAARIQEAEEAFASARDHLARIFELDPQVRPVEAALDLGIAQLAAETPADWKGPEPEKRSAEAVQTLRAYVELPEGRNDRLGHFFLGVAYWRLSLALDSAEELGRADASFARALAVAREQIRDEGELRRFENRVLYYQGLSDLSRGRLNQARTKLEVVGDPNDPTSLAQNARDLLSLIAEEQRRNPPPMELPAPAPWGPLQFEGSLTIGNFYDTNVILLGRDTALPRRINRDDDYRFSLEASFDLSRQLTRGEGILGESLLIGAGATLNNYWQPRIPQFDINTYSGRAYVNWEPVRDLFLGLQYDYSYNQLGHDPFISSHRITPVISKVWRETPGSPDMLGRTDLFYVYDYRDYQDPSSDDWRFDRDGNYHELGVQQRFNLWQAARLWPDYYSNEGLPEHELNDGRRWMFVNLGYSYRNESTSGDEFDLYGHALRGGIEVPLPWRLAFDFNSEFAWDNYWQPSAFDFRRNERFDFIQRYSFGLSRILVGKGQVEHLRTLEVKLRGSIDFYIHDSNVWNRLNEKVYEFDRAIYGLALSVTF